TSPRRAGWKISAIIADIQWLVRQANDEKFQYVKCMANLAADWVARQTREGMISQEWVERPSSSLVHIMSKDGLPTPH
ncbi:hypothetical protein CCACVL1_29964, partial [Corchorus capsularis]